MCLQVFFALSRWPHYDPRMYPTCIPFSAFSSSFATNRFLGKKLLTSVVSRVVATLLSSFNFYSSPIMNAESDWGLSSNSPLSLFLQFCLHPTVLSSFAPFCPEKSEGSTPINATPPSQQISHIVAPQFWTSFWPDATIRSVDTEELISNIVNWTEVTTVSCLDLDLPDSSTLL